MFESWDFRWFFKCPNRLISALLYIRAIVYDVGNDGGLLYSRMDGRVS